MKKLLILIGLLAALLPLLATPTQQASAAGYHRITVPYVNRYFTALPFYTVFHWYTLVLTADAYYDGRVAWASGVTLACNSNHWSCNHQQGSYWDPNQRRLHVWANVQLDSGSSQSFGAGYGGVGVNYSNVDNTHQEVFLRAWVYPNGAVSTYAGP